MVKSDRFQSIGISKTHVWSYETFAGMKIQRKHKVLWTVYGFAVVVLLLFCSRELCVRDLFKITSESGIKILHTFDLHVVLK